jgi:hypothetical protein
VRSSGADNEGSSSRIRSDDEAGSSAAEQVALPIGPRSFLGVTGAPNDVHLDGIHDVVYLGLESARSSAANGPRRGRAGQLHDRRVSVNQYNGKRPCEFVKLIESNVIRIIDLELS